MPVRLRSLSEGFPTLWTLPPGTFVFPAILRRCLGSGRSVSPCLRVLSSWCGWFSCFSLGLNASFFRVSYTCFSRLCSFSESVEEFPWVGRESECIAEKLSFCRVDPRVCGGTFARRIARYALVGLSPRLRGNQERADGLLSRRRSIPASAGEPPLGYWHLGRLRVYPRVCGGTGGGQFLAQDATGLSPRLRGNRMFPEGCYPEPGSIPASAGEPSRITAPRRT